MLKKIIMGQVIRKIKPNVPKTKYDKSLRDLKIAIQKGKGSKAKLDQTIFESKKGDKFTFPFSKKKTMSKSELKDQADYLNKTGKYKAKKRNEESKKMFKKAEGKK